MARRSMNVGFLTQFNRLVFLVILSASAVEAQSVDNFQALENEVWALYQQGSISQAIKQQQALVAAWEASGRMPEAWNALDVLFQLCQAPGYPGFTTGTDASCINWATDRAINMPGLEDVPIDVRILRNYFYAAVTFIGAHTESNLRKVFDEGILEYQDRAYDVIFYINRQLLAAEAHIELEEFAAARLAVDRAMASILSIENARHHSWQVSRWFIGAISIYSRLNDLRMAQSLLAVTIPFIAASFPPNSPDLLAAHFVTASVAFQANNNEVAIQNADWLIELTDTLNKHEPKYSFLRDSASTTKLGICFAVFDLDCINAILSDDIQNTRIRNALANPEAPLGLTLIEFIAARTIAIYMSNIDDGGQDIRKLIELLERHLPFIDDEIQSIEVQFALGTLYWVDGKEEFAREIVKKATAATVNQFRSESKRMKGFVPVPSAAYRIFWMLSLAGSVNRELTEEEQDFVFAMAAGVQRSTLNIEGDLLGIIADAESEFERKFSHQFLRTISRQRAAYTALAQSLVNNAIASYEKEPNAPWEPIRSNFELRVYASDFGKRRARLSHKIDVAQNRLAALPDLQLVQSVLDDNEVLLLDSNFGGRTTVCVRNDKLVVTHTLAADPAQFLTDIKLIQLALDSTNPPSDELDSQFPAESAVRLHNFLIQPVSDCLKPGDTVFVMRRPNEIPWEVLLRDMPNKKGSGYDLASANWAVKDYNFSYVGNVLEFLAGQKIDNRPRKVSGFFGAGDPVLDGLTESGIQRRALAVRGMVSTEGGDNGGLSELPETSLELNAIGNLFGPKSRVLIRDDATEARVRRSGIGSFEYISFATHGLLRQESDGVAEAALVLTPVSNTDSSDDGLLTASEIADFNLNARVVMLSACNTSKADQSLLHSEMQSLSAAFAAAGVPAVVATTDYVDSESARYIAERFFVHLKNDRASVAQALAMSKADLIEDPPRLAFSHPRFWSPMIAIGDSVPNDGALAQNNMSMSWEVELAGGGGEVLSFSPDKQTGESFVRFIGDPIVRDDQDGRLELQSWVAKISKDGHELWRSTATGSGNSDGLLPYGESIVIPGSRITEIENGVIQSGIVELNWLDKESGKPWRTSTVPISQPYATIRDALLTRKGSIVLLLHEWFPSSVSSEDKFSLVEIDKSGRIIRRTNLLVGPIKPAYVGVNLIETVDSILITLSSFSDDLDIVAFDEFHNPVGCATNIDSEILEIDTASFSLGLHNKHPNYAIFDVERDGEGRILVTGSVRQDCGSEGLMFVGVLEGGELQELYRDEWSYSSQGKGLVQLDNNGYLVVGDSAWPLDVRKVERNEDGSLKIREPSTYSSERFTPGVVQNGLIVQLDSQFQETDRLTIEEGADVSVSAGINSEGKVLVGGLKGSKAWLGRVLLGAR